MPWFALIEDVPPSKRANTRKKSSNIFFYFFIFTFRELFRKKKHMMLQLILATTLGGFKAKKQRRFEWYLFIKLWFEPWWAVINWLVRFLLHSFKWDNNVHGWGIYSVPIKLKEVPFLHTSHLDSWKVLFLSRSNNWRKRKKLVASPRKEVSVFSFILVVVVALFHIHTLMGIYLFGVWQVYKISIGAACNLSWPADKLVIQVLDDSTDYVIKVHMIPLLVSAFLKLN